MIIPSDCSFIDSHCHLDFSQFDADREQIIEHCKMLGVQQIILPGTTTTQWSSALALGKQHPNLHIAAGLHPLFIKKHPDNAIEQLEQLLDSEADIIAIGEIGLDYYSREVNREQQITLFQQQLELASRYRRPLLLHVRKAHQPVLNMLHHHPHHGGIIHAFSGSYEQAKLYIDQGFLIGIGGVVTRPNAHKLHRTVQQIPLDAMALETDAPDLSPTWAKGERNSPEQIPAIAAVVATLRTEPLEQVAQQTTANVMRTLALNG